MFFIASHVEIGFQIKPTVLGINRAIIDAADGFLGHQPIMDQIGDSADFQLVLDRKGFQISSPGHGAIVIHDFDNHGRRFKAAHAGQVATGLRMSRTTQYATRLGLEGKDMPRLHNILGPGITGHRHLYRPGAVSRRDPGGNTLGRFNGYGKIGAMARLVGIHHQGQVQLSAAILGEGQADQPAAVGGHKINIFRANHGRSHNQIAFIFTILVVHENDHFPLADIGNQFFDSIQCHNSIFSNCPFVAVVLRLGLCRLVTQQ